MGVADGECRGNVGAGRVESEPPGTGLAQGMSDSPQICQEVKGLGGGGAWEPEGRGLDSGARVPRHLPAPKGDLATLSPCFLHRHIALLIPTMVLFRSGTWVSKMP